MMVSMNDGAWWGTARRHVQCSLTEAAPLLEVAVTVDGELDVEAWEVLTVHMDLHRRVEEQAVRLIRERALVVSH